MLIPYRQSAWSFTTNRLTQLSSTWWKQSSPYVKDYLLHLKINKIVIYDILLHLFVTYFCLESKPTFDGVTIKLDIDNVLISDNFFDYLLLCDASVTTA